jgi:alpha 1,2-mannosyltransferase
MQDEEKVYGFTLSLYEYQKTIPTLWDATKGGYILISQRPFCLISFVEFIKENPQYLPKDNAMAFISDDGGNNYNLCHCKKAFIILKVQFLIFRIVWSNFEIGDLDFWRSEAYTKYFEHLDQKGGFYYERWGDAPVHSIGAALFARKDQIHFFKEIGYRHEPFQHCPTGEMHARGKCWCESTDTFDYVP